MKIVLDTNIIVRAVTSPSGLAAEILSQSIEDGNLLCTSTFMLAELDRVLRYPRLQKIHGLTDSKIEDLVRSIQQVALVVDVQPSQSSSVTRDIDDDPVVETAIEASFASSPTRISRQDANCQSISPFAFMPIVAFFPAVLAHLRHPRCTALASYLPKSQ